MKKSPNDGGCWFCFDDKEIGMLYDPEYDTFFHKKCLAEHIKHCNLNDCECSFMQYLLKEYVPD